MLFDAPLWLLLLLPFVALLVWARRRSYATLEPWARRASLVLRAIVLLLLVAALARPVLQRTSDHAGLVFAIDVSQSVSVESIDAAMNEIDRLASDALGGGDADTVSVIAFGAAPRLIVQNETSWGGWSDRQRDLLRHKATAEELGATLNRLRAAGGGGDGGAGTGEPNGRGENTDTTAQRVRAITEFRDAVVGEQTDLEQALRLAINAGRTGSGRTVYLFTDARETRGGASDAVRTLPDNVRLRVVALDAVRPPEVAATSVDAPPSVRVNESFEAYVNVTSSTTTEAELRLFKDGVRQSSRRVSLGPGVNRLSLGTVYFDAKGFHSVEAAVVPDQDTEVRNNVASALVYVPGRTRVLYVEGDEAQIPYLQTALELEGMDVDARPASGVPGTMRELLGYDAFILSNVAADKLNQRQMRMVKSYVEDFGGGFAMLGGENSFGLGGYYQTPIEEVLPVRMPIRKDLARPNLAVVLVIDKSGSMSGVKIQLAKRAAIATSEAINPRDRLGVVGFDGEARVILELTPAGDRGTISDSIAQLTAGGGTFLYPALEAARERLVSSSARRKHVIVLSDGQTQGFGYEDLAYAMNADGITISTVGIGGGADMNLLEGIAVGGRAYFTNDFYSIPQIFTREALRAANNMLVEEYVLPVALMDDPSLAEIDTERLPILTGYVATTPKAAADTVLVSDRGDPLLARWRTGLGYAAAFTSEPKPRWAEDWLDWPDFAKFWAQLIRSISGGELDREITVDRRHQPRDDGVTLVADVQSDSGEYVSGASVRLVAITEEGAITTLPVEQSAPGRYEARLPTPAYGRSHEYSWRIDTGHGETLPFSYGIAAAYPPEFASFTVDREKLGKLAAAAGSEVVSVGGATLDTNGARTITAVPLWPWLLTMGLLLVPVDILVRRIG